MKISLSIIFILIFHMQVGLAQDSFVKKYKFYLEKYDIQYDKISVESIHDSINDEELIQEDSSHANIAHPSLKTEFNGKKWTRQKENDELNRPKNGKAQKNGHSLNKLKGLDLSKVLSMGDIVGMTDKNPINELLEKGNPKGPMGMGLDKSLMNIFKNKDVQDLLTINKKRPIKLTIYSSVSLFIFLLFFILKRVWRSDYSFFKTVFKNILLAFLAILFQFLNFYLFFKDLCHSIFAVIKQLNLF